MLRRWDELSGARQGRRERSYALGDARYDPPPLPRKVRRVGKPYFPRLATEDAALRRSSADPTAQGFVPKRVLNVRGFVFDNDGTLVHRAGAEVRPVPGAREALDAVRASGRPFVVFTNGSHVSPAALARELRDAGLPVDDEQVLTPLSSVLVHLERYQEAAVLPFVTAAARDHLASAGIRLVEGAEGERVDAVFVGIPAGFDFERLERAAAAVLAGARLLTGSYVASYAGARGPIFSRGAMTTAAIAKATGARPIVVGKPSRAAVRAFERRLGLPAQEVAVIGDDVDADVALGRLGGSRTVLVRSGTHGSVDLGRVPERRRPDAVVGGVAELLDLL